LKTFVLDFKLDPGLGLSSFRKQVCYFKGFLQEKKSTRKVNISS